MKNKIKFYGFVLLMAIIGLACNNTKKQEKQMVLTGTIKGMKNGKVSFSLFSDKNFKPITAEVKDGKFEITTKLTNPPNLSILKIEGSNSITSFYADNVNLNLEADYKNFYFSRVLGLKLQEDNQTYRDLQYSERKIIEPFLSKLQNPKLNKEERAKIMKEYAKAYAKYNSILKEYIDNYIKENPYSDYRALLIKNSTGGKSSEEILKKISELDPKLQRNRIIKKLAKKAKELSKIEISVEKLMSNVKNTEYKVDANFKGTNFKNMVYLASFQNNVYAINKDGSVAIISESGKLLSSFKTDLRSKPSAIACDKENNIYVFASLIKEIKKKVRGKEKIVKDKVGVECLVYNLKGEKQNRLELKEVKTATGARVVDNTLIVSDFSGKQLVMFNKKSGVKTAQIADMRPCCGILDFSVNDKKQILVANLGAFRVQAYDFSGKNILQFGKRGRDINSFHGCCNPVSVAYLKTGAIVTVEKDPTRIKIYSKEGAKTITGIDELVKGCSYIPMTVDANDNLYLASPKKGIVKCVAK